MASESSKWEAPAKLSTEDEIAIAMDKMSARDGMILCATALLMRMQFRCRGELERDHYMDLTRNLLNAVKHAAEMELLMFLADSFTDDKKSLEKDEVLMLLAGGAEMAKNASLKSLRLAQNLAALSEGLAGLAGEGEPK
jgi:hypothetical protein